jgi:hypothetical protein
VVRIPPTLEFASILYLLREARGPPGLAAQKERTASSVRFSVKALRPTVLPTELAFA